MIAFLKEYNENIELVDKESYNRTDYDNLSRQIGVRLISLENDLLKTSDRKETIVTAREGRDSKTNNILGIYSYYQNKQEEQKLLSDIKIIKSVLGWLNEQNKNSRELEACQESIQKKQNNLYRAREINLKYVLFQEFKEQIELLDKNIKDTKSMNLDLENKISDIGSENNKLNEDLVRLNGMLNRDREKLYSLPALQNRYEKALKDIDNHKKNLKTTVDSIEKEEKKQDELSSVLRKFSYYESKVEDDVELLIEFDRLKDLEELITDLIKTTENLKILRKDIDAVQIKIDNQNQFNQELTRLINSGMDIINKSRSSSCPLCDQDYKTFENLTENILSNKALDSQLKVLLNEKNEKEVKLNNLEAKVDANRKNINKKILELKRPIINNLNIGKNSVEKLSLKKEEYLMKLEENQSLIDNAEKVLDGFKSFEELAEKLKNDNQRRVEKVNEISEQIKTNTQLIQEHKEKIEAHKIRLNVLESRAKEYRFLDDYLEVKNYFIKELNTEKTDKEIIINRITKIEQELDELGKKKKEYLIKLDDLKGKLENYPLDKQKYISELDEQNTKLNSVRKTLEIFENYLQMELGVKINDKNKSQVEEILSNLIDEQKEKEKFIDSIIHKYKTIRVLNEACIQATESKLIKDKIKGIKNELDNLNSTKVKLETERDNLKTYLKKSIEEYFYTPLINSIYQKIDPHPDYKKIEFECDFEAKRPRLQIFTTSLDKDGNEVKSVPPLYFSTAQVNILSLSIFLARALKTKDNNGDPVDCIFIDDPIQSMDSINVLSFIDLFRGIIASLGKQLIVSTHEENFHLLLQKKIPSQLFKAKFMEFETYGKLKRN